MLQLEVFISEFAAVNRLAALHKPADENELMSANAQLAQKHRSGRAHVSELYSASAEAQLSICVNVSLSAWSGWLTHAWSWVD